MLTTHGDVTEAQEALLHALEDDDLPRPVGVHCGVQWGSGESLGVSFFKPGKRHPDPVLAAIYDSAPRDSFIVVLSPRAMADDVGLIVTVAHELEHLRQEARCRGLPDAGNIAIAFVEQNQTLFPDLSTAIHVPGNAHAERAGARAASRIFGEERVQGYYASVRPDLLDVVVHPGDPKCACGDLKDFFRRYWKEFERWASATNQLALGAVRAFLQTPCD